MKKEFIIHRGLVYTIEWYYNSRGKSNAKEFYESLDFIRQKKFGR